MKKTETKMPDQKEEKIIIDVKERSKYIYIIQMAEHHKKKTPIYKIGRTHNILQRFNSYPKNSRLIYLCKVNDCHHVESELIELFKKNFEQKRDFGLEYFQGSITKMIQYTDALINTMNQRVDDDFDYIKNKYSNYLKITLHNETPIIDDPIVNNDENDNKVIADDLEEEKDLKEDEKEEIKNINEIVIDNDGYRCGKCNKKFSSKENANYHVINMVCVKEHKCRYCIASFTTKTSMYRHMREYCKSNPNRVIEQNEDNNVNRKIEELEKQVNELKKIINKKK